ncbi:hypothetical protein [Nonlabens sp.]|uniref:hypothetical protein n=1 Tax=Nonlabens sp. TaxID=1888209 RepID=UPI0025E7E061|nr:hypothetical protein [Nonlabens sp.]
MSKKKNIDKLFQEEFKDFEAQPPSRVWEAIEKDLDKNKKARVIPFWWVLGGVAAGLSILLTCLYVGMDKELSNKQQPFVNSERPSQTKTTPQNALKNNEAHFNKGAVPYLKKRTNDTQLATEDTKVGSEPLNNLKENSNVNTRAKLPLKSSDLAAEKSSDGSYNAQEQPKQLYSTSKGTNKKPLGASALKDNFIAAPIKEQEAGIASSENSTKPSIKEPVLETPDPRKEAVVNNTSIDRGPVQTVEDDVIENAIAAIDSTKKNLPTLEDIAAQEKKEDSIKENVFKGRWAATTQAGPVYSNSLSGSSVNNEVSDNGKNPGVQLSYGIGLSYELSPRLRLRTGVHQINMTYNTKGINYQVNLSIASRDQQLDQVYNASAVSDASTNTSDLFNETFETGFSEQELVSNQFQGIKGEIFQQLGYLEVPLELQYNLINRKFKISVLGGVSALFLTDNTVAVQNANQRLELGEDANFNDFNQSANFGLGFGYDFTNQLGAFIEPTFKYQLSTLRNNAAAFRPYTIGIHSGVIYRF